MILLFFLIVLTLACSFLLFFKDRRFLNKDASEVLSAETKKYLNLPDGDAPFRDTLENKGTDTKLSRRILDELNKN